LAGEEDCRVFTCGRCGIEVAICRRCDRGHRYCSRACSQEARRASMRRASAVYQQTRRGKLNHAARMRRSRQRRVQKVTHQGSPGQEKVGVVGASLAETAAEPSSSGAETVTYASAEPPRPDPPRPEPKGSEPLRSDAVVLDAPVSEPPLPHTPRAEPPDSGALQRAPGEEAHHGEAKVRCAFCGRWYRFYGRRGTLRRREPITT
jgi:hypothetical protein